MLRTSYQIKMCLEVHDLHFIIFFNVILEQQEKNEKLDCIKMSTNYNTSDQLHATLILISQHCGWFHSPASLSIISKSSVGFIPLSLLLVRDDTRIVEVWNPTAMRLESSQILAQVTLKWNIRLSAFMITRINNIEKGNYWLTVKTIFSADLDLSLLICVSWYTVFKNHICYPLSQF